MWFSLFSWMSQSTAERVAEGANIAFVASLIVGVIATIALIGTTTVKEWHWEQDRKESRERIAQADESAAKANESAAKGNERAATLENEAAQAKLELERLRGQMASRKLSDAQFKIISEGLTGIELTLTLSAIASDPESMQFAGEIKKALKAAGFDLPIRASTVFSDRPVTGIKVSGPRSDIERVGQVFLNAGFKVKGQERKGDVNILVGSKEPPN